MDGPTTPESPPIVRIDLQPSLDGDDSWRKSRRHVGLIVPATDATVETDLRLILRDREISTATTRIPFPNPYSPETLMALSDHLEAAAENLLPGHELDAVGFACTSASLYLGSKVKKLVHHARPAVPVTNPVQAGVAAMRALEIVKVALFTPYSPAITAKLAAEFAAAGLSPVAAACLDIDSDIEIGRMHPGEIISLADSIDRGSAEGLFISCTAMRSLEVLDTIEARIGIPVVSSNQALIWHLLRLAGDRSAVEGFGRLLSAC